MTHRCHALAATDDKVCGAEAHPAMPFCKHHVGLLPEPHKKRIWAERRKDPGEDPCGLCDPRRSEEVRRRRSKDWDMLVHLGMAMLLLIEFGGETKSGRCGCGAPRETLTDEQGFCWGCGINNSKKLFQVAYSAIKKYNITVQS